MAVNGVSFGEVQQQQQTKKSSGATYPVLGALAGGVTGYMLKAQPNQDEFMKRVKGGEEIKYTSELTQDEKNAVEKAKSEVGTEAKTEETKAEAKTEEAKTETKKKAKAEKAETETKVKSEFDNVRSALGDKKDTVTIGDIFGKKAELTYDKYLENKYGETSVQGLMDRIKEQRKLVNNGDVNYQKDINIAKSNYDKTKEFGTKQIELTKQNEKVSKIKENIADLEESLKEHKEGSSKYNSIKAQISSKNKELKIATTRTEKLSKEIGKINEQLKDLQTFDSSAVTVGKDGKTVDDVVSEMIEKAKGENGRAAQEGNAAAKRKTTELENEAAKKARENGRASKLSTEEIKDNVEKAKKEAVESEEGKKAIAAAKEKAVARKVKELKSEAMQAHAENFYERETNVAKVEFNRAGARLAKQKAILNEMETDLDMVRTAKKEGKAITKESAAGVAKSSIKKAKAEVTGTAKEAAKEGESLAAKAFNAVKEKLPKDIHSMKKAGLFALGGLAAGVIIKMIADGSSKSEAQG